MMSLHEMNKFKGQKSYFLFGNTYWEDQKIIFFSRCVFPKYMWRWKNKLLNVNPLIRTVVHLVRRSLSGQSSGLNRSPQKMNTFPAQVYRKKIQSLSNYEIFL